MTIPLVVLALGAAFAGVILQPVARGRPARRVLEPVVGRRPPERRAAGRRPLDHDRDRDRRADLGRDLVRSTPRAGSTGWRLRRPARADPARCSRTAGTSTTYYVDDPRDPGQGGVRVRRVRRRREGDRRRGERDRRRHTSGSPASAASSRPGYVRTYAARDLPGRGRRSSCTWGSAYEPTWLTVTIVPAARRAWPCWSSAAARCSDDAARWIALAITLVTFLVSLGDPRPVRPGGAPGSSWSSTRAGSRASASRTCVGIDGISIWMVLLTTFLFPIAMLASWRIDEATSGCTWARCCCSRPR